MLRHYAIVTNTIIISTYRLNGVKKYKLSCCQNAIKKQKIRKIYKIQTLVTISIHVISVHYTDC